MTISLDLLPAHLRKLNQLQMRSTRSLQLQRSNKALVRLAPPQLPLHSHRSMHLELLQHRLLQHQLLRRLILLDRLLLQLSKTPTSLVRSHSLVNSNSL
jgi:hypothetical protein